jgi:hypothetical protein
VPVFLNLNFEVVSGGDNKIPNPFPKDMIAYRKKLIPVFEYYNHHPRKDQIIMVCENEPNTKAYHSGPMADYLTMLETFVATAKPYGYKTTDGGLPIDSVNSAAAGKVGKAGEIWELLQGYANIPLWKVNLHTHNKNPKDLFDSDKIPQAVRKVKDITGKDVVSNEFHIEATANVNIIHSLCDGWNNGGVELAVFLSGTGNDVVLNQGNILNLFGREYRDHCETLDSFRGLTLAEEDDLDAEEDSLTDQEEIDEGV